MFRFVLICLTMHCYDWLCSDNICNVMFSSVESCPCSAYHVSLFSSVFAHFYLSLHRTLVWNSQESRGFFLLVRSMRQKKRRTRCTPECWTDWNTCEWGSDGKTGHCNIWTRVRWKNWTLVRARVNEGQMEELDNGKDTCELMAGGRAWRAGNSSWHM